MDQSCISTTQSTVFRAARSCCASLCTMLPLESEWAAGPPWQPLPPRTVLFIPTAGTLSQPACYCLTEVPYFHTSWTVVCVVTWSMFSRLAAWWCLHCPCTTARAGYYPEPLWMSSLVTVHTEPVSEQVCDLVPELKLCIGSCDSSEPFQYSETTFSYCLTTQMLLCCAGFMAIPNSAWGHCAWLKHCRQTNAAGAPPGVRETGFGWASGRPQLQI